MKKIFSFAVAISMFFCISSVMAEHKEMLEVFVQAGAENGDGSFEKPFGTLTEARDYVRKIKNTAKDGVNVYLREGLYSVSDTFKLTEEDSGSENAPISWQPYRDEKVTLAGGAELNISDFKIADDGKIPESAKGKVYKVNLKEKGIADYGKLYVLGNSQYSLWQLGIVDAKVANPDIIFEGTAGEDLMGTLARYPNDGYMTVDSIIEYGDKPGRWGEPEGSSEYVPPEKRHNPPIAPAFGTNDPAISRWGNAEDAWVFGYWKYDWSDQTMPVTEIDATNGIIKTGVPSAYSVLLGQRFYIYNLLEELDVPGEWFYDKKSGDLFVYPPNNSPDAKMTLAFANKDIVSMENAEYIEFKRINFKATRTSAVSMNNCFKTALKYCEVSNISDIGISVSKSKAVEIVGCHVYNTGSRGISVEGGNLETLEPSGILVENCWIHDFGRTTKTYEGGLKIAGVGVSVRHNLIYNGPHLGLNISGNDHLVEFNEIHSVMKEAADMGAVYMGRNMASRGVIIRENVIHDLYSDSEQSGQYGIYLDDNISGYTVTGNVFYNIDGAGVLVNGGRDNTVTGNIFANVSEESVIVSDWGRCYGVNGSEFRPSYFKLDTVPYKSEAYSKYPHLKDIENDEPLTPKYNVIKGNVSYLTPKVIKLSLHPEWGSDMTESEMHEKNELDNGYITTNDPGFTDVKNNNYFLKTDSIVFKKIPEFKNINMNKIGLTTSTLKSNLKNESIVMKIGTDMTYVNWKRSYIDEADRGITPFLKDGFFYIPLRYVGDEFLAIVDYIDGEAVVNYLGTEYKFKDGETECGDFKLAGPVVVKNGRTFITAEDAGRIFEKQVLTNKNGIIILSKENLENVIDEEMLRDIASRI